MATQCMAWSCGPHVDCTASSSRASRNFELGPIRIAQRLRLQECEFQACRLSNYSTFSVSITPAGQSTLEALPWRELSSFKSLCWDTRLFTWKGKPSGKGRNIVKVCLWKIRKENLSWVEGTEPALPQKIGNSDAGFVVPVYCGLNKFLGFAPPCLVGVSQMGGEHPHLCIDAPIVCKVEPQMRRCEESHEINEVIRKISKEGRLEKALNLLDLMDQLGIQVYMDTYISLLHGCIRLKALPEGKMVHACIVRSRRKHTKLLWDTLVHMYAKCGSINDAHRVFNKLFERSVFTWTIVITGYVKQGYVVEALKLFEQMQCEDVVPDAATFVSIIQACASLGVLEQAREIHIEFIKSGITQNVIVDNALMDMYAKCSSLRDARQIFEKMLIRDLLSWNTMMTGYAQHGDGDDAFQVFRQMEHEGVKPDAVTYVCILKACGSVTALEEGKQIYTHLVNFGFDCNIFIASCLVDMYAKCGNMEDAREVFDRIDEKDRVLWNAMIAGYAKDGYEQDAFKLYEQMQEEGVQPNGITFMSILNACTIVASLEQSKWIHNDLMKSGFESDLFVLNTLVDMYAKCGSVIDARQMFEKLPTRDVVSWNVMITAYAHHEHGEDALTLFWQMQEEGVEPNKVTYMSILHACASIAALEEGKLIHAFIANAGYELEFCVGSTIIDMYAKCGSCTDARRLLDKMPEQCVISWNALIFGYSEYGPGEEALKLFHQMQQLNVKPDEVTFMSILQACASLAALDEGKQIHSYIIKNGYESHIYVGSCLVDMYAKCGSIGNACQVFHRMPTQDQISWTAIITGFSQHGLYKDVFLLFQQMQQECVEPDDITFVCILSACSHLGLVDEGCRYFFSMDQVYNITPTEQHYACMVDLFGRAGCLIEAVNFINSMPFQPPAGFWRTLLGACRNHGDAELAKYVSQVIFALEPKDSAAQVLLSNTYAAAGRWNELAKFREDRRKIM